VQASSKRGDYSQENLFSRTVLLGMRSNKYRTGTLNSAALHGALCCANSPSTKVMQ
jgi:hypothetical protein